MEPRIHIRYASDAQSAWESATMPVPAVLRPHLRSWIGISETTVGKCRRREIPGPHVVMVFQFGPPLRISKCGTDECCSQHRSGLVAGLYDSFVMTEHDGHDASIQVNLTPLGARALLALPLSEIAGTVVALSDLLPSAQGLSDRLVSTTSWADRFSIVENVLIERLSVAVHPRADIVWAANQIGASGRPRKVGDLARALQMSRKHFNALFRDHVGISPKRYASLVRFEQLNARIWVSPARSWADLAFESGFADQAHMAREVRRFSGMSPTGLRAYLADMASLCPRDAFPSIDILEQDDASEKQLAQTGSGGAARLAR